MLTAACVHKWVDIGKRLLAVSVNKALILDNSSVHMMLREQKWPVSVASLSL